MRYFTLENSDGDVVDITTKSIFFHDISGLGFSEDTDFRKIGDVWWLNSAEYTQEAVSGSLCFTDLGDTTPYQKYDTFKDFIQKNPLILHYYPHGKGTDGYSKRVRITSLEKTEYNEYGVLDCSVEFTPYTPWYTILRLERQIVELDTTGGWIWGSDTTYPLVFDDDDHTYIHEETVIEDEETITRYYLEDSESNKTYVTKPKFRGEVNQSMYFNVSTNNRNPVKLTIYGPAVNPIWTLFVNGESYLTGGFAGDLNISSSEKLVVDNTDGQYSMKVYSLISSTVRNVYPLRDFDKVCFLTLPKGNLILSVNSMDGAQLHYEMEGHVYYATV